MILKFYVSPLEGRDCDIDSLIIILISPCQDFPFFYIFLNISGL